MNEQKLDDLIEYSLYNISSFNTLDSFHSRISALLCVKYNQDIENVEKEILYLIEDTLKKYLIQKDSNLYLILRHSIYHLHDFITGNDFSLFVRDIRERTFEYIKYLENIIFA